MADFIEALAGLGLGLSNPQAAIKEISRRDALAQEAAKEQAKREALNETLLRLAGARGVDPAEVGDVQTFAQGTSLIDALSEAGKQTQFAGQLASAYDLETIPDVVKTLSSMAPADARQLAKQLSQRSEQKESKSKTKKAVGILSKAIPGLSGNLKLLAEAGEVQDKPGIIANAIIQEGKIKPASIPGILSAASEGLADLSTEESRAPYWLAATNGNIERADALEQLYKQSVEKAPKDERNFWETLLPNAFGGKPAPQPRVTVISPQGRRGSIPASELNQALKRGYTLVR